MTDLEVELLLEALDIRGLKSELKSLDCPLYLFIFSGAMQTKVVVFWCRT